MAEKKITNADQIAAAQAANVAASQRLTALQAEAAKQQSIVAPTAKKAIPGISALTSGINAKIAELSGTAKTGSYNPITGRDTPVQSSSQLVQQSKNILGAISPTEISTAQKAALDYQKALEEAGKVTFTNVPGATYDDSSTTDDAEARRRAGQSAYDLLLAEFSQYGLASLVEPLKALIQSGPSSSELTLALRATDAYKKRFAANPERIKKGYAALNEASYLALEDGYQNVMRNYGLPASYYSKDSMGRQVGFETLIGGDVKVPELEERIILGKNQLLEAPVETRQAFTQFFPDITEGDILGYVLNPEKGLSEIKRKVSAAQIGGAFLGTKTTSGATLTTSLGRAEELARAGVTGTTAKQVATAIGGGLERGRQLTSFYQQPDYTQAMAEEELFNLPGQTEAKEKRKKIIGLEGAEFGKRTGLTSGALSQNRAGSY